MSVDSEQDIRVNNLSKSYMLHGQQYQVLRKLNCVFPAGKISLIVGKSGCGKTTLLRLLARLEDQDGGSLELPFQDCAFVFQEPRLMPWLSVKRNILFGMSRKERKAFENDVSLKNRFEDLLSLLGIKEFENAYPQQLSGGMQQRVSLGRALLRKPAFLFMDEPFAALDYFTRAQMQQELKVIQKQEGCGVLMVSHSLDEACILADKIVVLRDGSIAFELELSEEDRLSVEKRKRYKKQLQAYFERS